MSVRWADKNDIVTLAAGDKLPVSDVSDVNATTGKPKDKYTTPTEILNFVATPYIQTLLNDANAAVARGTLELATTTTDNAIIRADGTSGKTQNSGVTIDDSGNIAFQTGTSISWNSGDVSITHSANALAFTGASNGYSFDDDILQGSKGAHGMWTDVSPFVNLAKIDRLFVGQAALVSTGTFDPDNQGGALNASATSPSYLSVHAGILSIAKNGGYAIVGYSRTSDQFGTSGSIGTVGGLLNDKSGGIGWAFYSDIQHENGALSSYGIEIAVKNKSATNTNPDPYAMTGGGAIGIWLAGGSDNTVGGTATNPSAVAIGVLKNAHTWNKGIVFRSDAITGTDGVTGTGEAITMARGHQINWYYAGSNFGAGLESIVDASASSTLQIFDDKTVYWQNAGGKIYFQATYDASSVNYIRCDATATGVGTRILALGDDTNIDMAMTPKGTGVMVVNHTAGLVHVPGVTPKIQVNGTDGSSSGIGGARFSAGANGASLYLAHSRNASIAGHTILQSGDGLGGIQFGGSDGAKMVLGATIIASVDGTPGTDDMPTRITFSTSPDGSATPTERLRIDSVGFITVTGSLGRGSPVTKTGNFTLAATENNIIVNNGASTTVTLPAASSFPGREVLIKTIQAQTVVSNASNVAPRTDSAAGTAILAATDGAWALLVSDGTNWICMAGTP